MCFDQDTWVLNVAKNGKHYFRAILPPELSKQEAKERADIIASTFHGLSADCTWGFSLTRWELRGTEVSF